MVEAAARFIVLLFCLVLVLVLVKEGNDDLGQYALLRSGGGGQEKPEEMSLLRRPTITAAEVTTEVETWTFSFYSCQPREGFCGTTYSGTQVGAGLDRQVYDAACGWDVPLGTEVTILRTGVTYTCTDRGSAVHSRHIDVWFWHESDGWRWQSWVGSSGMVEIGRTQ